MLVLSLPAVYSLELTAACNNCCPGCSNAYASARTHAALPASTWVSLLETFAPEATRIRLTGGEPTLHPEFSTILKAATAYDAWATIFTNGRWPDPVRFVKAVRETSHLTGLLVSLHGATAQIHEAFSQVPGSFDETVANIRRATDAGIPVATNTVVTPYNWDRLESMVALGRQIGAGQMTFNRYLGPPSPTLEPTPAQMRHAIAEIETLAQTGAPISYGTCIPQCFTPNRSGGCSAGATHACIDPWGNVRPCIHSPTVVGSLLETPLTDLWHGEAMMTWRESASPDCASCAARTVCYGGCRAARELHPDALDPLRSTSLTHFSPAPPARELPAQARPRPAFRVRLESFGYALLGQGQVVPVRAEAKAVIEACDGQTTFTQLAERFGQNGLDLLGELWALGLLEIE
jgi:radical SAM protein with 4Fe4S-binding SPASM domain